MDEYLEDTFVEKPKEVNSLFREVLRNNWGYYRITIDICIGYETYEIGRLDRLIQFK